jgi:hypothetical protein
MFINGNLSNLVERGPNELKRNFFSSNNSKGIVEVREFKNIYIPKIYPYTDLKINHNSSGIKLTFAKGKRGDLSNIEINWNGISSFEILNEKLIVHNSIGIIDFEQPIAYQISSTNVITTVYTYNTLVQAVYTEILKTLVKLLPAYHKHLTHGASTYLIVGSSNNQSISMYKDSVTLMYMASGCTCVVTVLMLLSNGVTKLVKKVRLQYGKMLGTFDEIGRGLVMFAVYT